MRKVELAQRGARAHPPHALQPVALHAEALQRGQRTQTLAQRGDAVAAQPELAQRAQRVQPLHRSDAVAPQLQQLERGEVGQRLYACHLVGSEVELAQCGGAQLRERRERADLVVAQLERAQRGEASQGRHLLQLVVTQLQFLQGWRERERDEREREGARGAWVRERRTAARECLLAAQHAAGQQGACQRAWHAGGRAGQQGGSSAPGALARCSTSAASASRFWRRLSRCSPCSASSTGSRARNRLAVRSRACAEGGGGGRFAVRERCGRVAGARRRRPSCRRACSPPSLHARTHARLQVGSQLHALQAVQVGVGEVQLAIARLARRCHGLGRCRGASRGWEGGGTPGWAAAAGGAITAGDELKCKRSGAPLAVPGWWWGGGAGREARAQTTTREASASARSWLSCRCCFVLNTLGSLACTRHDGQRSGTALRLPGGARDHSIPRPSRAPSAPCAAARAWAT